MSKKNGRIKIVFFADSHLGIDYPIRPRINRRHRGADFFDNYARILDYAKTNNADLLIHGGDMFFRSRVHAKIVDMAYEPLVEIADGGIPVIVVPGNHERSQLPSSLFLSHKNIFVFDRPRTFFFTINALSIALFGFPFQRGDIRSAFVQVLSQTQNQQAAHLRLLCMHQAVEGATVGPSNYTFRHNIDTIRQADIPDWDAVLSGHIHRHQILSVKQKKSNRSIPVIYPGSIERTAFAEMNEEKGFVEFTCSASGIEHISFIKLPARQMVDLVIEHATTLEKARTEIEEKTASFEPDAIVRIKINPKMSAAIKPQLNTSFFRRILPETMNIQLARDLSDRQKADNKAELLARIKKFVPSTTGVYLFKADGNHIIYIGKSVNLMHRMSSYFFRDVNRYEKRTRQMVSGIRDFDFFETETELLALLLEDRLIKKHLPDYNVKQKEFSEYRYLVLTNDRFPTLKIIEHADVPEQGGRIFGPFKDQYFIKDVLDIIYAHLNIRQCPHKEPVQKRINYELGLCTGPCRGKITQADYRSITRRVADFLNGDESFVVEKLKQAMQAFSDKLEFEQAAQVKRQIEFCQNMCSRQRFLFRFRTQKLWIKKNGPTPESYFFENGHLINVQKSGESISPVYDNELVRTNSDERFLLDRANIVLKWLNTTSDVSLVWT